MEHKNVVIQHHVKCLVHLFFEEEAVVDYSDFILGGHGTTLIITVMTGALKKYAVLVMWAIVDIIMRGDHHKTVKDMFLNAEVRVTNIFCNASY